MQPDVLLFSGKLTQWNAERGFGFVVVERSDQQLFVHISAFPRKHRSPAIGERLEFEMGVDAKGRKRVKSVHRVIKPEISLHALAPEKLARPPASRPARRQGLSGFAVLFLALMCAAGVGWLGYSRHNERAEVIPLAAPPAAMDLPAQTVVPELPGSTFQCDGRKHCSQMTSCREATQFLQNCPGMEMDGDGDGIPCEQQWCTGTLGG